VALDAHVGVRGDDNVVRPTDRHAASFPSGELARVRGRIFTDPGLALGDPAHLDVERQAEPGQQLAPAG
jgi:hypothetical protein